MYTIGLEWVQKQCMKKEAGLKWRSAQTGGPSVNVMNIRRMFLTSRLLLLPLHFFSIVNGLLCGPHLFDCWIHDSQPYTSHFAHRVFYVEVVYCGGTWFEGWISQRQWVTMQQNIKEHNVLLDGVPWAPKSSFFHLRFNSYLRFPLRLLHLAFSYVATLKKSRWVSARLFGVIGFDAIRPNSLLLRPSFFFPARFPPFFFFCS